MRSRRGVVAIRAATSVLVLAGCSATTAAAPKAEQRVVHVHNVLSGVDPGLSNSDLLNSLIGPPHVLGFVKGVVTGPGSSVEVQMNHSVAFTDFPLRVTGFVGPVPSPYAKGSSITLRVPGGSMAGTMYIEDGAPSVVPGQTLYVLYRNQGKFGGGNSAGRIVASIAGQDVFYDNAGTVSGQGRFRPEAWSEPEAVFEAHFPRAQAG
jgi:hypothetical protein